MRDPDTMAKLKNLGANPIGSTPEELDKFWNEQLGIYVKIAEKAGVRMSPPGSPTPYSADLATLAMV
jgi:hypothetical protein